MADQYTVVAFQRKMDKALARVKVVLDANRAPCFASDIHHQYQDKYLLAECMTNTALGSQVNCLTTLGLTPDKITQLCEWAQSKTVSLKFRSEERCNFAREETREVESKTKHVTEIAVEGEAKTELTSKVVTTVTDYFWTYTMSYEIIAIRGVGEGAADRLPLSGRSGEVELKTSTKSTPYPEVRVPAAECDVNISWLCKKLDKGTLAPSVEIDRSNAKCATPRRNPDMENALGHFMPFASWASKVGSELTRFLRIMPRDAKGSLDMGNVNAENIFVPVLPLFEDKGASGAAADAGASAAAAAAEAGVVAVLPNSAALSESVLLAIEDTNSLLKEEMRSLLEKHTNLQAGFPSDGTVATAAEATAVATLGHCSDVCASWARALDYIEGMLLSQLIAAIGKEVTPADFAEYMTFHNRKLFAERYAPSPFCFAVRRSERHSPEGTLSIEQDVLGGGGDSNIAQPIVTLAAHSAREHRMNFPISASTNVSFGGDKYLHAWLQHQFSGQTGARLSLVSRARQFSSFLVLVGRIVSATTFEPKYAAIIQNKDELKIPLDLSTIPTPKEFKDAIESLSPEMQAFAKAFRSMQLESTLFGILVIQIKPQLEKVLNLPEDSLTKEIKLTQELMQLFIKYQIPSDLLSFDGTDPEVGADMQFVGGAGAEKLDAVKAHVKAMYEMIAESQREELEQRQKEVEYQEARRRAQHEAAMLEAEAAPQCAPSAPVVMASAVPCPPAAAPAPAPAAAAAGAMPQPPSQQNASHAAAPDDEVGGEARDYTKVPREMDQRFERLDLDSSLRPTIISPGGNWTKKAQKALLAAPTTTTLYSDQQKTEKDAAFDLLDALTKSGAIPVENASLHIVVAATHCFDRTVTDTVVIDNVNPIDKVERSTLIMATTVHQQPAAALIREAQVPRVSATSPMLFLEDA